MIARVVALRQLDAGRAHPDALWRWGGLTFAALLLLRGRRAAR